MTGSLIAGIDAMVQARLSSFAFRAVVSAIVGQKVFIVRPGQTRPDVMGYVATFDASTLAPGDVVSVLQHGASYAVIGKFSTTVTPPPPVPPPPTATGAYLGALLNPDPAVSGNYFAEQAFEVAVGRNQAIMSTMRDWATLGTIPTPVLPVIPGRTTVPLLTWNPWNSFGGDQSAYTLANILAGNFDVYLTAQSAHLAAFGRPVLVRFAQDMNTADFPWCGDAPNYILAWRHVQGIVKGAAPQTQFVWCPRVWGGLDPTSTDPSAWYPGDDVVDWVGLDGYNSETAFGSWLTFTELFGFSYGQVVSAYLKPFMLGEWGCDDDPRKPAWFTSALTTEIPSFFPKLAAEVYTDVDRRGTDGLGTFWSVDSTPASLAAFAAGVGSAYYVDTVA